MIYKSKEHLIHAFEIICGYNQQFVEKPFITIPINDFHFVDIVAVENSLYNFDKDGFEISDLEKLYFKANGLHTTKYALNHETLAVPWYQNSDFRKQPTIHIDHSFISIRPSFNDAAWEQLQRYKDVIPTLIKPLKVQKKYGLDISLEIIDGSYCSELFHLEYDFSNFESLWSCVQDIQSFVNITDWNNAIESVKQFDRMFANLLSDDESDLKVKLLGYNRTFNTVKAIR